MDERDNRGEGRRVLAGVVLNERVVPFSGRLVFGLILLAVGVAWTLDNLGLADADSILRWWPVLLLAFGLMKLTGIGSDRSIVPGILFSAAGALLLGNRFSFWHVDLGDLWAVFLIGIGVHIVWRAIGKPQEAASEQDDSFVRAFALMGGITRRNGSDGFRGGDLSAMMGGVELDLREARMEGETATIEVFAMWGGIEIIVPADWRVTCEVTPIMGGIEDATHPAPGETLAGTLIVRGTVVMGGIEVKNSSKDSDAVPYVRRRRREREGSERDESFPKSME